MENTSLAYTALRLVAVLALMIGVLFLLRRMNRGKSATSRSMPHLVDVVARQPLGRNSALVVVRVGNQLVSLAVTEQSVTVIGTCAEATAEPPLPSAPAEPVVDLRSTAIYLDDRADNLLNRLRQLTAR